jgi:hypothetical protein
MRTALNEAAQTARLAHNLIDEEEQEQEVAAKMEAAKVAADNIMITAKAKSKGARARRELSRKRFEINATLSETLAQIEDDYSNDLRSSHGLDAESVGDWVGTTHGQSLEVDEVPVGSGIGDRVISSQVSMPEFASGTVSTLEVYIVPVVPGFGDSEMKPQVSTPEVASGVSANC